MLMLHLLRLAKDPRAARRVGACDLFANFCQVTDEDFSAYHTDWYAGGYVLIICFYRVRQLISSAEDSQEAVVDAAGRAFESFSKTLTKDQIEMLSVHSVALSRPVVRQAKTLPISAVLVVSTNPSYPYPRSTRLLSPVSLISPGGACLFVQSRML